MRISKPKRGRAPVKRLDLTDMRELFRDRRVWSGIAIVAAPDDGEDYFEIVTNAEGTAIDITVECVLQPSEVPITCRLPAGVFDVPDEGDEVGVILPMGELDFMPIIVCRLSRNIPTTQGPAPGRIAIIKGEVVVHDGAGGAVSLALKSDSDATNERLEDHIGVFNAHLHPASAGTTSPPLAGTHDDSLITNPVPTAEGTSVLLGK